MKNAMFKKSIVWLLTNIFLAFFCAETAEMTGNNGSENIQTQVVSKQYN